MSYKSALHLLFPNGCNLCGTPTRRKVFCPLCPPPAQVSSIGRCTHCFSVSTEGPKCAICKAFPLPFRSVSYLYRYEGLAVEILHGAKFHQSRALRDWLGDRLEHWIQLRFSRAPCDLLVSIPSSRFSLGQSPVDLPRTLASRCSKALCIDHAPLRFSDTKRVRVQHLLGKARRKQNKRSFVLHPLKELEGKRVLLIDDICTTGRTALDGCEELLRSGAERVDFVSLARAPIWETERIHRSITK